MCHFLYIFYIYIYIFSMFNVRIRRWQYFKKIIRLWMFVAYSSTRLKSWWPAVFDKNLQQKLILIIVICYLQIINHLWNTYIAKTADGKFDNVASGYLGSRMGHGNHQWYGKTFLPRHSMPINHIRLLAHLHCLVKYINNLILL